jgi:hypothetical protein
MKNKAVRYLVLVTALLLLTFAMAMACAQPKPNPAPVLPKPQVTQPPVTSENQSPKEVETPPANQAVDEDKWYLVETFSDAAGETTPIFHIYGTEWRLTWTIDAQHLETAVFKLAIYPKDQPYAVWQTVSNAGESTGTVNYFLSSVDKHDFRIKVTAQYLQRWTIVIEDNATAATFYPVQITFIHYKGTIYPPDPTASCCTYERVEPDEYVVIKNLSEYYQDMSGWVLKNISNPGPPFKFPTSPPYTLAPGGIIRVYTDEYHSETGGLSFYYGYGDIWSNDKPNTAVLYDAYGKEVSRKSYAVPTENE